ncbi:male sterility protein-domain-containing protein [Polychytrium aggregatum]|uniref:male sterility protein-domain-containing protein n=1 Tax=Polychytrium aggregatum TaxID=110093 RepID=UPI0022FDCA5A|nr:male sterility protein-domain-containing protein [Polychytrium aggregatum]KAI9202413.1 male sterility protein-domain-containing protein [Polychytrium aggregatum]
MVLGCLPCWLCLPCAESDRSCPPVGTVSMPTAEATATRSTEHNELAKAADQPPDNDAASAKPRAPPHPLNHPIQTPPMDPFGPWVHPLAAMIQLAATEPECLAIYTREAGPIEKYTYRQLWDRAFSVAQCLKQLPGWTDDMETVALHFEPEAHWVFSTYAAWILGKKVINFALNWPASVRNEIAKRLSIKFVLYYSVAPGRIEGVEAVDIGSFSLVSNIPRPSTEHHGPLDDSFAYLCTSGTTGTPKTFPISHTAGRMTRPSYGGPYRGNCIFQKPSFSASFGSLAMSSNIKGSVWFPKLTQNYAEQARSVVDLLDDGLDILKGTPSFIKIVFRVATRERPHQTWPHTKQISMGSELIPIAMVWWVKELCPNALIQCGYASSESSVIQAFGFCVIRPSDPTPERLVYSIKRPNVTCLLFDEDGNPVDRNVSNSGILVFAVGKDDSVRNHPSFVQSNREDRLASFGYLEDGSPRVCTMDHVELVDDDKFVVFGRVGQKVKVNGVFVDLNSLENIVTTTLSHMVSDCIFIQTSELEIILIYSPNKDSNIATTPKQVLEAAESILLLQNIPKVPIHNCLELDEFPFNDSGKRDLKKLRRFAEHAKYFGESVIYPTLDIVNTPLSRTAAKISTLGSQIIDNPALDGRNYYIGGVGFDSLSVGRLALAIKDEFNVEISPLILLSNGMTPTDVAQLVVDILDDRPMIPPTVDLAAEAAKLDDASVTAEGLPPFVYPKDPRGIVLTGATGFLGAFLVFELAHKFPRAKIYCLVRAPTEQVAVERIISTAQKLVLDPSQRAFLDHSLKSRLVGLCGNLSQDKWGLSDERWKEISEETDMIVHNGAEVHWLFDYDRLRGPNVLSTATALRLATTHHLKPLHYISTIGTIPMAKKADKPLEEKIYSAWNISGGYGQTKWVSEQLVNKARSRGVPATIIRPAVIAGDSQYGVSNSDDYIWRYVKGCIQLGVAPSHATLVTMTMDPVDHVAKVVAEIAGTEESLSKFVFHISDSEHSVLSETRLFEIVRNHGWPILFETREQFKEAFHSHPAVESNALFPLMHIMMDMSFKIDNANTRSIYPTPCPSLEEVVEKCISYLNHARFLPNPIKPSSELKDEEYPEVSIFGRTGRS